MKTDTKTKKWAHRFMLAPRDMEALRYLVAQRKRSAGNIHSTEAAREAIALVAAEAFGYRYDKQQPVKVNCKTAIKWSLTLRPKDIVGLNKIRNHYGLHFRNETLCFALRTQALVEGWKE